MSSNITVPPMSFEGYQAGLFAFFASLALVPLMRAVAQRKGWVCVPKADRWSKRPVALFGGVAIFLAYLVPIFAFVPFAPSSAWSLVAGGSVLFLLGVVDDALAIKPSSKLIGQIIGASVAVMMGHQLQIPGLELVSIPLSIFWIVAITNAYNLIDNMDGLAAGVGVISLAFMLTALAGPDNHQLLIVGMSLLGSLLGFLIFNFNPASIFMGDSGSMFIGFTLAVLSLHSDSKKSALAAVAVPCLALLVPLLDMTLVSVTRILTGRSVAQGGRDHSSHRLVSLGLSERKAVLVLYALAALAGGAAVIVNQSGPLSGVLALAVIVVAFGLFGVFLSQMTFSTSAGYFEAKDESWPTRILFQLTFKRRMLEVALDMILMMGAYCVAFVLRFGLHMQPVYSEALTRSLPLVVSATFLCFFAVGVYRGMWRFTGPREVATFFAGSTAGAVLSVFLIMLLYRFENFSRSVFPIYAMLLFIGVSMTRYSFRIISGFIVSLRPEEDGAVRVLIYGAGDFGDILVSEFRRQNGSGSLKPVGFLDDNKRKHNQKIHGLSVLGGAGDLEAVHRKTRFQQLIVSSSKISRENMALIGEFCRAREIPVKRYSLVCEEVA